MSTTLKRMIYWLCLLYDAINSHWDSSRLKAHCRLPSWCRNGSDIRKWSIRSRLYFKTVYIHIAFIASHTLYRVVCLIIYFEFSRYPWRRVTGRRSRNDNLIFASFGQCKPYPRSCSRGWEVRGRIICIWSIKLFLKYCRTRTLIRL